MLKVSGEGELEFGEVWGKISQGEVWEGVTEDFSLQWFHETQDLGGGESERARRTAK